MRGVIATGDVSPQALVERARASAKMEGADWVKAVTCEAPFDWTAASAPQGAGAPAGPADFIVPPSRVSGTPRTIAAYDLGMKWNILRRFTNHGLDVPRVPGDDAGRGGARDQAGGIFFSNGPGDPAALDYVGRNAKVAAESGVPVFGICLGHQVLAHGHGRHDLQAEVRPPRHQPPGEAPRDRARSRSRRRTTASPSTAASLPNDVEVTHLNLYDNTVEGLKHRELPVFCVQYHPEAAPGPHDADYLFGKFLDAIDGKK